METDTRFLFRIASNYFFWEVLYNVEEAAQRVAAMALSWEDFEQVNSMIRTMKANAKSAS